MFYDAHLHCKKLEVGGFLVGLEGEPKFENTYSNSDVLKMNSPTENSFSFYYVTKNNNSNVIKHKYLKFHPRREHYDATSVVECISINEPKCVMIDTLNEPFWTSYDYWSIARKFENIPFVFAHSGGYLINDFIKMCHFQKNIWIDYALTHTILGKYGEGNGLNYINDAINFSLNGPFKNRILLSSDYPFFEQNDV